jgi:hypothetical protein
VGGNQIHLLVDGAEPTSGWFEGEWALVGIAPGPRKVTARCTSCAGAMLGEASVRVTVQAGALSEARLDVVAPPALGSLTVTWDPSDCSSTVWVGTLDEGAGNPTCKWATAHCADGSYMLTGLLPGHYTVEASRPDPAYPGSLEPMCACRGYADVVVPPDPVPVGSTHVGPIPFYCGGWCL